MKLGACVDSYAYCVVSKENCAGGKGGTEPYCSHQETLDKYGVNYYLSTLPKLIVPKPPTPPPTPPPDVAEARASADDGGPSDSALVSICAGSAVAAFDGSVTTGSSR